MIKAPFVKIKSRLLLLLVSSFLCSVAHAQTTCPWLTEGTAAALLNGSVTFTTNLQTSGEGICTFTLQQNAATSILEINVTSSNHPACPADSKQLPGIGNEAVTCSLNETADIVSSRVRKLYFTVRLTLTGKPVLSPDQRRSIVQQAAEAVAGDLF